MPSFVFLYVDQEPRSYGAFKRLPRAGGGKSSGPAERGFIAVCTRVTRHVILVRSIDLNQHLFGIDSIQLMIQSGFCKNESLHLMIQAVIQKSFDSVHDSIKII